MIARAAGCKKARFLISKDTADVFVEFAGHVLGNPWFAIRCAPNKMDQEADVFSRHVESSFLKVMPVLRTSNAIAQPSPRPDGRGYSMTVLRTSLCRSFGPQMPSPNLVHGLTAAAIQ